jgi:hypothetical protein
MNTLIREMKTRARLMANALDQRRPEALAAAKRVCDAQRWPWPERIQLKHALNIVSAQIGFDHWEHARHVLAGDAAVGEDMGSFWYDKECSHLFNHWYADHRQAVEQLHADSDSCLLPYRRHFVVVAPPYLEVIRAADATLWRQAGRDAVESAGSEAWLRLCEMRLAVWRKS